MAFFGLLVPLAVSGFGMVAAEGETTEPGDDVTVETTEPSDDVTVETTEPSDDVTVETTEPGDDVVVETTEPGDDVTVETTEPGDDVVVETTEPGDDGELMVGAQFATFDIEFGVFAALGNVFTSINVTPPSVGIWDAVRIDTEWAIPDTAQSGDTFYLTLPVEILAGAFDGGIQLRNSNDDVVATASFDAGTRTVTFTLTDFVNDNFGVTGTFWFESAFDVGVIYDRVRDGETVDLTFDYEGGPSTFPIEVTGAEPERRDTKWMSASSHAERVEWGLVSRELTSADIGKTVTFRERPPASNPVDCNGVYAYRTLYDPVTGSARAGQTIDEALITCPDAEGGLTAVIVITADMVGPDRAIGIGGRLMATDPDQRLFTNDASVQYDGDEPVPVYTEYRRQGAGGDGDGEGITPSIEIVKEDVDGNDANDPADPVLLPDGSTGLVFTITNDGEEALRDIVVSDQVTAGSGTVSGLTCDFSPLGGPASGTTWAGPLAIGASFVCEAELSGVVPGELHTDVATVTGVGVVTGRTVDDDDPYNAETPPETPEPSIEIVKEDVDGNDANDPADPVLLPDGSTGLVFTITNDGEEALRDIVVSDQVTAGSGTVSGLTCDFSPLGGPASGTTWAGPLAIGASFVCEAELSGVVPGELHTDVATVTGVGVVTGRTVDDDDPYNAETPPETPEPSIEIVKEDVDGNDANDPADPVLLPDGSTGLVFTITNDGEEALRDIVVSDQVTAGSGTVSGLTCDFSPLGGPASGTTWAGPLAIGASFVCEAELSGVVPGELHTDVATVTGVGVVTGRTVDDDDPYNAETPPETPEPSIEIVKEDVDGNDANDPADPALLRQGATTLVFTITNDGEEALRDIVVSDQVTAGSGTVSGLTCDFSPLGGPASGTTWAGPLAIGASFVCEAELSGVVPGELHTDVATVTGVGVVTGRTVDDDDPYNAETPPETPEPSIEIVKEDVDGNDANDPADPALLRQGATTLVFTITNDGSEDLVDVEVTDVVTAGGGVVTGLSCDFSPLGGPASGTTWAGPLAIGASFVCEAELSGVVPGELHTDVATVTGVGAVTGNPVDDDDPYNAITPKVSVGDYVWFDADHDGLQDADEDGIPGVTLTLTGPDGGPVTDVFGNPVPPVQTGPAGEYVFDNLPPLPPGQSYTVTVTPPAGYLPTLPNVGGDPAVDSSTGSEASSDLTADGDHDPTLDFGFWIPEPSIEIVKEDVDGNDANDPADPALLRQGATTLVFTITNDGSEDLVDVEVTDVVTAGGGVVTGLSCDFSELGGPATGTTWAGPLLPGDSFECAAELTGVAPGDPHTDVATVTGVGAVTGNPVDDDDPYNAITPKVSVGDYVWWDVDKDGVQDAGEPGIPGVTLTLTGPDGGPVTDVFGNPVPPVQTGPHGEYVFDNLPPLPPGQSYTVTVTPPPGYLPTLPNVGGDPAVDSSTGSERSYDLTADGDHDPTLDFGYVVPSVRVGDKVWHDQNRDGRQDPGEPGIPDVTLTLLGPDGEPVTDIFGNPVSPVQTGPDGEYVFENLPVLPPGRSYRVRVTPPAGWTATLPNVGDRGGDSDTDFADSWELTMDGDEDMTLDFGFYRTPPAPPGELPATR